MADAKISALTAATTPLAGTEVLPIVQSGTTKKVSVANLTSGRVVDATGFISGSATADVTFGSGTTAGDGPNAQFFGKSNGAAPGWAVYTSGTSNFASFGIQAFFKNDFAGNSTYLGGWFTNGDYRINNGNLTIGTANKGIQFSGNNNVVWICGAGTPENSITAPVGSLYTRTDGGTATTLYVKESGAGNTGWVAK